jgi:hypothetical protein
MAAFFNNFLASVFGADGYMRDYQHARALYRDDNIFDLAPKAGWMYYVRLEINPSIRRYLNKTWAARFSPFVGILAKASTLPKFTMATETVNQYNRRTVVQTKLSYQPVTITFHDDMANATTDLWQNYYQYYFADGRLNIDSVSKGRKSAPAFADNKYSEGVFPYGLANGQGPRFFSQIEIFLLNKQKFQSFTLVNPIIKDWEHGTVGQDNNRLLESKMIIEYESVIYNKGKARQSGFTSDHYDTTPSPLRVSGNASLLGPGGVIQGAADVIGEFADLDKNSSFLEIAGLGIKAAQVANQASKLTEDSIKQEGYSVLLGQLGVISRVGIGGGVSALIPSASNSTVDLFKQFTNKSTNGGTEATQTFNR